MLDQACSSLDSSFACSPLTHTEAVPCLASCVHACVRRAQYSAERSCLVLLGGEDLDTLAAMAREAFSDMRSGLGPRPSIASAGPPFAGRRLYVVPAVKNEHELKLTFQLPPQQVRGMYDLCLHPRGACDCM